MTTLDRRTLLRRASGLLVAAAALALPAPAKADEQALHHCGQPFGPLHNYLWNTAPYPAWQHDIITRESMWDASAYNPSGAAGLCQFMPSTWAWGSERFGVYGSPYDPYAAIDMMNAFMRAGESYHWSQTGG